MAGIFINYRVGDEPLTAALLDVELSLRFDTDLVFRASKSIPLGDDFEVGLLDAVRRSDVLLAVIGVRWLTVLNKNKKPRIWDESDWVRRELAMAFQYGIRVIPILVADARMPESGELPDDLAPLATCQNLRLDHRNVAYACAHLADRLAALAPHLASITPAARTVSPVPIMASESLTRTEEGLASMVRAELEAEERQHRLAVPRPLHVWWSTVNTVPELSGWVHEIAEAYLALPGRRMVVLGSPGAGKTTLGILLALDLLRPPRPTELVPVLLPLAGWNPHQEHLLSRIGRQLDDNYPALSSGRRRAGIELAKSGHILPVLDGLDEIHESLRPQAIDQINRALPVHRPLVLTCRSDEFDAAVAQGDEVISATVITLSAVEPVDARSFLEEVTPERRRENWTPVFDRLENDPQGPVARALDTPLMVWLARTMYARRPRDPKELLDFTDPDRVKEHLLDELVPTVFGDNPPDPAAAQPSRPWGADRATAWLGFLAGYLKSADTLNLAWWELYRAVPHRRLAMWLGTIAALLSVPVLALHWSYLDLAPLTRLIWVVSGAATIGIFFAFIVPSGRNPIPLKIRFHSRPRLTRSIRKGIWFGLTLGSAGGVLAELFWDDTVPLFYLVAAFAVVMALISIPVSLVAWLIAPVYDFSTPPEAMTPRTALRKDRAAALVTVGIFSGMIGLPLTVVVPERTAVVALVLAMNLTILVMHAWGRYRVVAAALALCGRLPWRLARFLDDAHRMGVLRQVGPVHQFRHSELRDRLTTTDDPRQPS